MVTGVTVCVHWLTENTTLTQRLVFTERERERERESGSPGHGGW